MSMILKVTALLLLQGSVDHCIIGVHILSQLVCEMNQVPTFFIFVIFLFFLIFFIYLFFNLNLILRIHY